MIFHFIGIGGVGMSALARIVLQKGFEVSGSDLKQSKTTQSLEKMGIKIFYEHKKENVLDKDFIVYTTAVEKDNPEFLHAPKEKLLHRSDLLEKLVSEKKAIVIAGAHGKTTTTSLMAYTLKVAGLDPSFAIGGFSKSLDGLNGKLGKGEYFVVEGDESDGSFLKTKPFAAIITNVDFDHLDYWKEKKNLIQAYKNFANLLEKKENLAFPKSDPFLSTFDLKGISFGEEESSDLKFFDLNVVEKGQSFSIFYKGRVFERIYLNLMGVHNVYNALGVFAIANLLGIEDEIIRKAFQTFEGVERRLEFKKEFNGAYFFDDYAHHPEEIKATLGALGKVFQGKKKVGIFQPHRNSRFSDLFHEFIKKDIWQSADKILVTDIYSAGEKVEPTFTIKDFIREMKHTSVEYVERGRLAPYVKTFSKTGEIYVTLGAGDITKLADELHDE
jgi:UDP-N-acetylmuramate--alanine ligase